MLQKCFITLSILSLFVSTFAAPVYAASAPPTILSYQGRLTDASGNLLGGAGTNYYLKFSLWDSPTVGAGNRVWPATAPATTTVSVAQGVFTVNIGDVANGYADALNINFANYSALYVQVEVSANNITSETLSPRQQLTSVPYAQVAGAVVGASTASQFGTTTAIGSSFVTVQATSSTSIPLSIAGASGQSANLFQILNNSLSSLFSVSNTGAVTMSGLGNFGSGFLSNASSTITSGLFSANGGASTTVLTSTGSAYLASAGGAVGIGTSTPAAGFALAVQGNTYQSGTSYFGGVATFASGFNALGTSSFFNASSTAFSSNTFAVGATGTTSVASNGTLTAPNITIGSLGGLLKATAGVISAAVAGVDYANFLWPFTPQTYGVSTSTIVGFTNGLLSTASSTFTGATNFPGGVWNSAGNVGVGTTTPVHQLAVSSTANGGNVWIESSANNAGLVLNNTQSGGRQFEFDSAGGSATLASSFYLNDNTGSKVTLLVNSSADVALGGNITNNALAGSVMSILHGGNVGIGTTTPAWNFQVAGTRPSFALTDTSAGANLKHWLFSSMGGNLYISTSTDAYATSSAPAVTILNNDNVGIGTSSPAAALSIQADDNVTQIFNVSTLSGLTAFHITASGNVGSGTTTPGTAFAVGNTGGINIGSTGTSTWGSAVNGINLTNGCFAVAGICIGGGAGGASLTAANTWTQLQQFSAGITAYASTTLGNGTQTGGLTISGAATTTGNAYFAGNLGIGNTTPTSAKIDFGVGSSNVGQIINIYNLGNRRAGIGMDPASSAMRLYSSSVDTFALSVGTVSTVDGSTFAHLFDVLTNGNVGIGTTTPGSLLSIGSTGTGTNFYDNATTSKSGVGGYNIAQGCFAVAGTCIGGGVGGGASLTVANTWTALQQFNGQASSTQLSATQAYFGGTATSTFTSAGFLGIGTSTPAWNLQVAGTRPSFALTDSSAGANLKHWLFSSMGGNLYVGTTTDAYATTTASAFTLMNNGRVGIGSSTPFASLSIQPLNSGITPFAIGSSTATVFSVGSTGNLTIGGTQISLTGNSPTITANNTGGGTDVLSFGSNILTLTTNGQNMIFGQNMAFSGVNMPAGYDVSMNNDTVISRLSAGVIQIGASAENASGTLLSAKLGLGSTTPSALLSVGGNTYFGSSTASTMTIHSGVINYFIQSTTTVPTGAGAWSIATSSTALNSIISINNSSTGATSTISFFGATTTGLTAGVGVALNSSYQNSLIIGNGKVLSSVTISKGSLCVSGAGWCTASSTGGLGGSITARNYITTATVDVAEMFQSDMPLQAGDIVAVSSTTVATSTLTRATSALSSTLVGIVSTDPGLTLGRGEDTSGKYPIALVGRVPVHVNLDNGPIAQGDRITISTTTPGFGMKAGPNDTTVGIALEPFTQFTIGNSIVTFVNVQTSTHGLGIWDTTAQVFTDLSSALVDVADGVFTTSISASKYVVGEIVAKTAVIGSIFAKHIFASQVDVGTASQPAGITLYDTVTHAPYCMAVTNGAPVATAGVCGTAAPAPAPVPIAPSDPTPPPADDGGDATTTDNGSGQ